MEIEENVCVQEETGQIAEAKEGAVEETREENGSTVMGKFKDVNALIQAYASLQAEFTRRSQRLKELEREAEHLRGEQTHGEYSGVEKLRKNAEARRERAKKFDEFLAEVGKQAFSEKKTAESAVTADTALGRTSDDVMEKAETIVEQTAAEGEADNVVTETAEGVSETGFAAEQQGKATEERAGGLEIGMERGLDEGGVEAAKKDGGENPLLSVVGKDVGLSSQTIYEQACRDETARLRIIGEYLASIGKTGAPLTVSSAGIATTPPLRARSIDDAGDIALRYFKKQ